MMIPPLIRKPLDCLRNYLRDAQIVRHVERFDGSGRLRRLEDFDFDEFSANVLKFVQGQQTDESGIRFRYSASSRVPTLYASTYACMTFSLLQQLGHLNGAQRQAWREYLDSFQSPDDGLFYDPAVMNDIFPDSDWWGARHLALHLISAYTDLGGRPRYPFKFLSPYYDVDYIRDWLDAQEWQTAAIGTGDIDNKIMNIGCLLQYQRDQWSDAAAGEAISYLKEYLLGKINPATGMWGGFDPCDPAQRSRMVQFAYHLFPLFFYDGHAAFDHDKIVELVLQTQNIIGGWGVRLNSSACEDIDSIDILVRLAPHVPGRRTEIDAALCKAFRWVLCNQGADGGFVFRLFEPFVYGHDATSSARGEGALLPTWFRTLSLAYLARYLSISDKFVIRRCPGYEF